MKVVTNEKYPGIVNLQIVRFDTKNKILDIQDFTEYSPTKAVEKVILNFTDYSVPGKSVVMKHYLDLPDLLLLAEDVVNRREIAYKDYKGSKSELYPSGFEARELIIEIFKGDKGNFINFTFNQGPGIQGDQKQVSMNRSDPSKIKTAKISIPAETAREQLNYLRSWYAAKLAASLVVNYKEYFPVHTK